MQHALAAVYLGNIASLFIRGATFLKVIESISSGWPGCVDILQYLPVTFAHFDARPSFTHENTTSRSWAQNLISKIKRSVAGRATVKHLQGSGKTWGQRNKTRNMTVTSRRTKLCLGFFLPFPSPDGAACRFCWERRRLVPADLPACPSMFLLRGVQVLWPP